MHLIDYLRVTVPLLAPQPLYFQHGKYEYRPDGGVWMPTQDPDGKYPLVLADVFQLEFSADFRLVTYRLSLLFAQPHDEALHEVPELQRRAVHVLQQLLQAILTEYDVAVLEPPRMELFHNSGANRLGGANAFLALQLANPYENCCPQETTPL